MPPAKEKSDILKALKTINLTMAGFQTAVNDLNSIHESVSTLDERVTQYERETQQKIDERDRYTKQKIAELDLALKDNRLRAIADVAKECGKVILNAEEYGDLKDKIEKVKKQKDDECTRVIDQKVRIAALEHERDAAKMTAECETYKKEISILRESIERMSKELSEQKELTSSVFRGANTANAK